MLADELRKRGLRVERQVPTPIRYGEITFDEGFRADLAVEGKVIVELKSVECLANVHMKQVLTHLRLTGLKSGFPLNFGGVLMKGNIKRIVNGLDEGA